MLRKIVPLAGLALLLVLASCSKPRGTETLTVEEIAAPCNILDPLSSNTTFVINSLEELQSYTNLQDCPELEIDFTNKTLLGQYAEGSGCNISFDRNLYHDHDECTYQYIVKVNERGLCEMLGFSLNWIAVAKLDPVCEVKFEVER